MTDNLITITVLATEIEYETDGERVDLPDRMLLEIEVFEDDDDDAIAAQVADAISDDTGWCVEGFQWDRIAFERRAVGRATGVTQ